MMFLRQLDNYIFNEVARQMNEWYEKYRKYVPISVNISRVDVLKIDMCFIKKMNDFKNEYQFVIETINEFLNK